MAGPVDDHLQKVALGIIVAVAVTETIFMSLRLWSRRILRQFWLDDWILLMAWVLTIGETVTAWMLIKAYYLGIHIYDVPKNYDLRSGLKIDYINRLLYHPCLSLVKASVLILFLRISVVQPRVRTFLYMLSAVNMAYLIAAFLVEIFQCTPVRFMYNPTIPGGRCINEAAFFMASASIAIITDILVLITPLIITKRLGLPARQKIAVTLLLSLGGMVTIASIVRLVFFVKLLYFPTPKDSTYNISFVVNRIETGLAVITACASSLKPIIKQYLPQLLNRATNGNNHRNRKISDWTSFSRQPPRKEPDSFQLAQAVTWKLRGEFPDYGSQRNIVSADKPVEHMGSAEDFHEVFSKDERNTRVAANGFV